MKLKIKVPSKLKPLARKISNKSPELLLVGAGVTGALALGLACKETVSAMDILDEHKKTLEEIEEVHRMEESGEIETGTYPEATYKKDIMVAYSHTGVKLAKNYTPTALCTAVTVALVLSSYNIMKKRNVALTMAYAGLHEAYTTYRKRVIEDLGKEKDMEYRFGKHTETVTEEKRGRGGKIKEVEKEIDVIDAPNSNDYSVYARFFDESCVGWTKYPEYNLQFLKSTQKYANQKLRTQGYLFLNDVYEALGMPKTVAGQMVGWLDKGDGDGFVDFGIYTGTERSAAFVNCYERSILLDFNVDGVIIDKVGLGLAKV